MKLSPLNFFLSSSLNWFLECLWGIETTIWAFDNEVKGHVFRVPMRNWNNFSILIFPSPLYVFRVPMRNWNSYDNPDIVMINTIVFRVPMRNWNFHCQVATTQYTAVFRVPMRNWNCNHQEASKQKLSEFLECLWGIETCYIPRDRQIKQQKFLECLWGIETFFILHKLISKKWFLECLWGIET